MITASLITIGDELLIGQTIDTNSAWLGTELNKLGVWVKKRVAVGDNKLDILDALQYEINSADIIIITGGLGPTADDITKPLLCDFFDGKMVMNEQVKQHVIQLFTKRNRPIIDDNIAQAMVPDVCEIIWNEIGTAPGMLFKQKGKFIFSLPGVPFEMQHIMQASGFNIIKENFKLSNVLHRTICTAGKGESFIALMLKKFEQSLPSNIKLAYLPNLSLVKLRLTGQDSTEEAMNEQATLLEDLVSNIAYANTDITLQESIGKQLVQKNATLSIAESCTGGLIADMFTNITGSSQFFKTDLVCYSPEAKQHILDIPKDLMEEHSVVSKEVAICMAENMLKKFNTTYAIATTGYLEQFEGKEPQVWIAVSDGKGNKTAHFTLPYKRLKNKELAANMALNLLRLFLKESE